jgi:hypothetical protein
MEAGLREDLMGFFRTNWLILVAGLTVESLWQYFLSTLPHLEEVDASWD